MRNFGVKLHWFDIVFLLIRTSWFVLALNDLYAYPDQVLGSSNPFISTGVIGLVSVWLTMCFLVPFLFYYSKKYHAWSPLVELILSGGLFLYLGDEFTAAFNLFNVPVFTIAYFCSRNQFIWLYILTIILVPTVGIVYNHPFPLVMGKFIDNTIMFGIGVCFRTMISSHFKMKELVNVIKEQNQTLEVYSKQIEQLSILEERNRLASELHDTVGHTFTSTILGMEAIYYQMEVAPSEAKENLKKLVNFSRTGYSDVRRHIHQIASHEEEASLTLQIEGIVNDFKQYTDTNIQLEILGEEKNDAQIPEAIKLTLIRCLQESLTNAKRHGHASEIAVQLAFELESIRLSIADNGVGDENLVMGYGLKSMNNRLVNFNGNLEVSSSTSQGTR